MKCNSTDCKKRLNRLYCRKHPNNLESEEMKLTTVKPYKRAFQAIRTNTFRDTKRRFLGLTSDFFNFNCQTTHNKSENLLSKSYNYNNDHIKKKLEEYCESQESFKEIQNPKYNLSSKVIREKLKRQAITIRDLLLKEAPVQSLEPFIKTNINITLGEKYNGKIICKGQPSPLIVRITLEKVIPDTYLYFSLSSENPNRNHHDKSIKLNMQNILAVFREESRNTFFTHNWVGIGLESSDNCSLSLLCSFGKCILQ